MDGLGEKIAVRLLQGPERVALPKAQGWDKTADKNPLGFNAPVARKLREGVHLLSDKDSFKPVFGDNDGGGSEGEGEGDGDGDEHVLSHLSFGPLLPEMTSLRIELPKNFKDASGRSLRNVVAPWPGRHMVQLL